MAELKENIKKPLGRGLGSLLGDDLVEEFRSTGPITATLQQIEKTNAQALDQSRIWMIDIEKLAPNIYQPRKQFANEKIKELSASIKEKGILQPIVARQIKRDHFEIIAGERRWRAAQMAGLLQVPVILKNVKNQESLELALIENIQRHDLNPVEEAEAYKQLSEDFNLSQAEISQKVGKDRATVANALRLLGLPSEVRQMLISGEITTGHAKVLLALADPEKQKELAKKITSEKLTVRAAEKLIQSSLQRQTSPALENMNISSKLVQGLEGDLAKVLGTKVDIAYNKGRGQISINFYSDEDLNRIIEKIKK